MKSSDLKFLSVYFLVLQINREFEHRMEDLVSVIQTLHF